MLPAHFASLTVYFKWWCHVTILLYIHVYALFLFVWLPQAQWITVQFNFVHLLSLPLFSAFSLFCPFKAISQCVFLTPRRPVSLIFSYFSSISTIHFIYFLFNVLVPPVLQLVDSFIFPPLLLSQSLTYLQHSCLMNNGGETVTISRILPLISDPVLLSSHPHNIHLF